MVAKLSRHVYYFNVLSQDLTPTVGCRSATDRTPNRCHIEILNYRTLNSPAKSLMLDHLEVLSNCVL